jgi:hypothetical protein
LEQQTADCPWEWSQDQMWFLTDVEDWLQRSPEFPVEGRPELDRLVDKAKTVHEEFRRLFDDDDVSNNSQKHHQANPVMESFILSLFFMCLDFIFKLWLVIYIFYI